MMDEHQLKQIVEALLVSHHGPLSLSKMRLAFEEGQRPSVDQLKQMLEALSVDYALRAFELVEVAGGYVIQTKREFSPWITGLQDEKPAKYSRALLETLAIIAYKQPVSRADIEEIRGVSVTSAIIKTLMERDWIQIKAYKEVPGKPALYSTTVEFLNYFNLKNIQELPSMDVFYHPELECPT